ncbi:hypothetical protein ABZ914_28060 [Spirillospora sp. NPDC046719]
MANRTISGDPLAALAAHQVKRASDLVTCRARSEDFGNAWFWTSWGEPIARADRVTDAAVVIRGYLAGAGR